MEYVQTLYEFVSFCVQLYQTLTYIQTLYDFISLCVKFYQDLKYIQTLYDFELYSMFNYQVNIVLLVKSNNNRYLAQYDKTHSLKET